MQDTGIFQRVNNRTGIIAVWQFPVTKHFIETKIAILTKNKQYDKTNE